MADTYFEFSEMLLVNHQEEIDWLNCQLECVGEDGKPEARSTVDLCRSARPECHVPRFMYELDQVLDGRIDFGVGLAEGTVEPTNRDCQGFQAEWYKEDGEIKALWIYAEEHGQNDSAAYLVQMFLRQFQPDGCWSLTYSYRCSKPRVGEFGGGAVFVTANDAKWMDTHCFVEEQHGQHKPRSADRKGR